MPTCDFFAPGYASAREKFLSAAEAAGAKLSAHALPEQRGPEGEPLCIDVAVLGAEQPPEAMLLLISGTHGVEGRCGSGIQVGYCVDQLHSNLPPGTATLLIHALNPYGFAWHRRVNEDNIDLNRNFRDFSAPLPDCSAYEAIHDCLVPESWDGHSRLEADRELQRRIVACGIPAYQAVLQRGQYTRPTGLFYGGTQACWSNRMLRRLLREHIPASTTRLAVLDIHTGLGPLGYGEPIYAQDSVEGLERARRWFGPEVTSIASGPGDAGPQSGDVGEARSASAAVSGALVTAFQELDQALEVTYLALEFGTRPILDVLGALRADSWLHAIPDRVTPHRGPIQNQMQEAFHVDTPGWKAAVYGRTADFVLRAGRGLAEG
ncbi:MAG: DUF2817 domain-containing protein [Cyanobacteria bacterium]|nr:DUF2817 domain-containing protein [Cyanobacteria bacterium bin.51]